MGTRPDSVRLLLPIAAAVWIATTTKTHATTPEPPTHAEEVEWFRERIQRSLACPDLSREPGVFGDVEVTFKTRTKFTAVATASLGPRFASCVAKALHDSDRDFPIVEDKRYEPRDERRYESAPGQEEVIVFSFGIPRPNLPEPARLMPVWKTARRNDRPVRALLPPDVTVTPEGCLLPASAAIREGVKQWLDQWSQPVAARWSRPLEARATPRLVDRSWLVVPKEKTYCLIPLDGESGRELRAELDMHGTCWRGGTADILVQPRLGFPTDRSYRSVSMSRDSACAVDAGGAIVCCGSPRPPAPPAGTFKSVSVGGSRACAVRSDDTVVCWTGGKAPYAFDGRYAEVVVGDHTACARRLDSGRFECRGEPVDTSGDVLQVTVGVTGACVLRRDGTFDCADSRASPPPPSAIAVEQNWTICALVAGGEVLCPHTGNSGPWGLVSRDRFKDIATAAWGGCGRRADDTVACWGRVPGPVPQGRFKALDGGDWHICGIRDDGRIACWGGHGNPLLWTEFE